jgi:tetratricopeptide (TPR) repeat protein
MASAYASSAEKAEFLGKAGRGELARGNFTEAVSHFNGAIYLQPNEATLYAQRAEAHLRVCDLQSAIANLRKAHKLSVEAADAARHRQQQQQQQQQQDAADGGSVEAAEVGTSGYADRLAHVLDLRAVSLLEDGAHSGAAPLLTEALDLVASERSLWMHRALAYTGLEQYEDALSDLAKCVEMDDSDADVHFLRAKLFLLGGNLDGARRAIDGALRIDPRHAEASDLRLTMGECADVYCDEATKLVLLGSNADAISNLTHAMALRPDDPSLLMRRGAARRQQGMLLEASRDLERAIRLAGGKYPQGTRLLVLTYNDLAIALVARKGHAEACGWLDRAIELDPTVRNGEERRESATSTRTHATDPALYACSSLAIDPPPPLPLTLRVRACVRACSRWGASISTVATAYERWATSMPRSRILRRQPRCLLPTRRRCGRYRAASRSCTTSGARSCTTTRPPATRRSSSRARSSATRRSPLFM